MLNNLAESTGVGIFALLTLIPVILYLVLAVFGIYFVVKVIKFLDIKAKLDHERNEKLDELIRAIKHEEGNK